MRCLANEVAERASDSRLQPGRMAGQKVRDQVARTREREILRSHHSAASALRILGVGMWLRKQHLFKPVDDGCCTSRALLWGKRDQLISDVSYAPRSRTGRVLYMVYLVSLLLLVWHLVASFRRAEKGSPELSGDGERGVVGCFLLERHAGPRTTLLAFPAERSCRSLLLEPPRGAEKDIAEEV
jgi:hypothetical protein